MTQPSKKIMDILSAYEETPKEALWNCHGTWVVYHSALERIAAKAKIEFETPSVLVAEREAAALLVTGKFGDKREWSIGEAVINQNYKVSGKQAAYPFAMAEKRGKDRVILKLIGLHGLAYSEEEADDFKSSSKETESDAKELFFKQIQDIIDTARDGLTLIAWWNSNEQKQARSDFGVTQTEVNYYKKLVLEKNDQLKKDAA